MEKLKLFVAWMVVLLVSLFVLAGIILVFVAAKLVVLPLFSVALCFIIAQWAFEKVL